MAAKPEPKKKSGTNRITRTRQSKKELQIIQQTLLKLSWIADAYFFFDRDWRIMDIGGRGADILDRHREELIGHNVSELYPDTVGLDMWRKFRWAVADGKPTCFETKSFLGSSFYFDVHALPIADGLAVYLRHTTERKLIDEQLNHLMTVAELNPDPILEVGDNRLLYSNPAANNMFPDLRMMGMKHPVLVGINMDDFSILSTDYSFRYPNSKHVREVHVNDKDYLQTIYYLPHLSIIRIYMKDITDQPRRELSN